MSTTPASSTTATSSRIRGPSCTRHLLGTAGYVSITGEMQVSLRHPVRPAGPLLCLHCRCGGTGYMSAIAPSWLSFQSPERRLTLLRGGHVVDEVLSGAGVGGPVEPAHDYLRRRAYHPEDPRPRLGCVRAHPGPVLRPDRGVLADLHSHQGRPSGGSDHEKLLTSAGRPVAIAEVRVAEEDGNPVPEGKIGEILVRDPHMFLEYLNKPRRDRDRQAQRLGAHR